MAYGQIQPQPEPTFSEENTNSKRGLFIVLGVVGGVLLLLAIVATVLFGAPLLKSILGGGSSSSGGSHVIAQIEEEPDELWEYRYAGASESYVSGTPLIQGIGDDAILTMSRFDYWGWQDENYDYNWYEGFSEDYAEGYAGAGGYKEALDAYESYNIAWDEAYQAWQADYDRRLDEYFDGTGDYPDWDWDESLIGVERTEYPDYYAYWDESWDGWGYSVGWDDRLNDLPEGENDVDPPEDPSWKAEAILIDAKTSDERWNFALADSVDDFDYTRSVDAIWVDGSSVIVFAVPVAEDEFSYSTELVAVSISNGEVVSSRSTEGYLAYGQDGGDLLVLETPVDPDTFENEPGTLSRLDPAKLDAEPQWSKGGIEASTFTVIDGYVMTYDFNGGDSNVLDASSGERANWGRDMWIDDRGGVFYEPMGKNIIRADVSSAEPTTGIGGRTMTSYMTVDGSSEFIELSAVNSNGDKVWDRPVEVGMSFISDGYLIVGEVSSRTGAIEDLMRLDPGSGEQMWDGSNYDAYSRVVTVVGDVLLAVDEDESRLVAIELDSGEVRDSQRIDPYWSGFWVSESQYYVTESSGQGRLQAYSIDDSGSLWSMRYDSDNEYITRVGDRLALVDHDRRTVALLE